MASSGSVLFGDIGAEWLGKKHAGANLGGVSLAELRRCQDPRSAFWRLRYAEPAAADQNRAAGRALRCGSVADGDGSGAHGVLQLHRAVSNSYCANADGSGAASQASGAP